MMGFRKPVEEEKTGSYQASGAVGRGKQGSKDPTVAVGLCRGENSRVISGEERLGRVVTSEGALICLPNVL